MWRAPICLIIACSMSFAAEPTSLKTDGIVTDELGQPVAGATIELVHQKLAHSTETAIFFESLSSTLSGVDGSFHLSGAIPCGEDDLCSIRAVARGRAYGTVRIEPQADGKLW